MSIHFKAVRKWPNYFILICLFCAVSHAQDKVQGTTLLGELIYLEIVNENGTGIPCSVSDLRQGIDNLKTPVIIANCYYGGFLGNSNKYFFKIRFKNGKPLFIGLRLGDVNSINETQMKGDTNLLGTWINSNFGFYYVRGEKPGDELFIKGYGPNPTAVSIPFIIKSETTISACVSIFEKPMGFDKIPERFKHVTAKEQFIVKLVERKAKTQ